MTALGAETVNWTSTGDRPQPLDSVEKQGWQVEVHNAAGRLARASGNLRSGDAPRFRAVLPF